MSTQKVSRSLKHSTVKCFLAAAAAASALAIPSLALADPPVTMAPPVDQSSSNYYGSEGAYSGVDADGSYKSYDNGAAGNYDDGSGNAPTNASSTVFNWQEIPTNQEVPIRRAVFDQGGYQLYDTVGETIVVPFANNNLYVMKFAVSPNGRTYFVNDGSEPILFLPRNAYLENASVSGARWFPFSDSFHPAEPVFLGCAPSYPEFVGEAWYPDEFFYGGYYSDFAFGVFTPTIGLFFNFGGHPYYGWGGYRSYYYDHPHYYRTGYYHPYVYRYAGRSYWGGRSFHGYGSGYDRGYSHGYDHGYNQGYDHGHDYGHGGGAGFAGDYHGGGFGGRTFYGAGHAYNLQSRSFAGENRGYGNGHSFGGGVDHPDRDRPVDNGVGRFEGSHARTVQPYDGGDRGGFGQGHTFNGGGGGATRTYSGNNTYGHAYDGNGEHSPRSFGGGDRDGGFHGGSGGGNYNNNHSDGFHGASSAGGGFHGGSGDNNNNGGGGFHGGSGGGSFGHGGGGFHGGSGPGR